MLHPVKLDPSEVVDFGSLGPARPLIKQKTSFEVVDQGMVCGDWVAGGVINWGV